MSVEKLEQLTLWSHALRKERAATKRPVRADCTVCGRFSKVELDHPIPKACGGEFLIPLCLTCHDSLDRSPLLSWSATEALSGLMSLWGKCGTPERLMILKMVRITCHGMDLISKNVMEGVRAEVAAVERILESREVSG